PPFVSVILKLESGPTWARSFGVAAELPPAATSATTPAARMKRRRDIALLTEEFVTAFSGLRAQRGAGLRQPPESSRARVRRRLSRPARPSRPSGRALRSPALARPRPRDRAAVRPRRESRPPGSRARAGSGSG